MKHVNIPTIPKATTISVHIVCHLPYASCFTIRLIDMFSLKYVAIRVTGNTAITPGDSWQRLLSSPEPRITTRYLFLNIACCNKKPYDNTNWQVKTLWRSLSSRLILRAKNLLQNSSMPSQKFESFHPCLKRSLVEWWVNHSLELISGTRAIFVCLQHADIKCARWRKLLD
jgi:hypothetical protein